MVLKLAATILIGSLIPLSAGAATDPVRVCSLTGAADPLTLILKRHTVESDRVSFQAIGAAQTQAAAWLKRACATQVSCDVLVVNTELFKEGKSGAPFQLRSLFAGLTKDACPGILTNPVQVIVFGKATLDSDSETFLRETELFSGVTEVYGFAANSPSSQSFGEAFEDFAADTVTWLEGVRTKMKARDAKCRYAESDRPKPREIAGAEVTYAAYPQNRTTASATTTAACF